MSYDCCQLCGKQAKEQGVAMTEACEREGCPGAIRKKEWEGFLKNLPLLPSPLDPI